MIIPSKHVLLITAAEQKQIFMFDPKTACVLHTYSTQSTLAPTAAYFQQGQQFLIPHLNNSYVNVWDSDAQEPKKFSVGEGQKITSMRMLENNVLYLGSSQGNLYTYQLPSGILIKKVQLHSHSSQIRNIIYLKHLGYLITSTKKQIKLWPLRELIDQHQKPIAQKSIHSIGEIIGVELIRGILCVVSQRSVQFYYANNFSLFTINRDLPSFSNLTCCCISQGSLYLGDVQGKIRQIIIDAHQKQLQFQNRKGKIILQSKKSLQIQTKDPISYLSYVSSLQYLIVGNCKGQIKIFNGKNLKNSVQLFKSAISQIFVIPRPNKQAKISHDYKIKSLHKQEMSKLDQPIYFQTGDTYEMHINQAQQKSNDDYLSLMLAYLSDPTQQLENEIQQIKKQNKELLESNMHYFQLLQLDKQQNQIQQIYK